MAEANSNSNSEEKKCQFCGKTQSQVHQMFTKQDGTICSDCVLEFAKSFAKDCTNENTQKAKKYVTSKLGNVLDRVINRLIYKI